MNIKDMPDRLKIPVVGSIALGVTCLVVGWVVGCFWGWVTLCNGQPMHWYDWCGIGMSIITAIYILGGLLVKDS